MSRTYTRFGQLSTVTDAVGSRSFGYRTASDLRLESETIQSPFYTKYITRKYDAVGRSTGFKVGNTANSGDDYEVTYGYDNAGRLGTVAGPDQATFTYGYEANSVTNLIASVSGPVHIVTNVWEPRRDVLNQKINQVGTTPVSSYDYAVNRIGQRTAVAGTSNYSYWYDEAGELVTADHTSDAALNRAYAYDGIGNRLWESQAHDAIGGVASGIPVGGQATDYDSNKLNQYTAVGAVVPAHDFDGNLTAFGTRSYTWNGENRMIEARENGGIIATFSYDYLGRRIRKTAGGVGDTFYLYDGWNLIGEYSTATPLQPRRTWTWGLDLSGTFHGAGGVGGLLSMHKPQGSASQFYTFDGNGNVSELLDEQGVVVGHYEYDPFGNVTNTLTAAAPANPFRFSTKFLDAETDLYYYGYRFYDPETGTWISRDPIGERGGLNLYGFVDNSGVNRFDALGLIGYDFREGSCVLKVTVTWSLEFVNSPGQPVWDFSARQRWRKDAESAVEDYFNNLNMTCVSTSSSCCLCQNGVSVEFNLRFRGFLTAWDADFQVTVTNNTGYRSNASIGAPGVGNFTSADPYPGPSGGHPPGGGQYTQTPIVHETGHMLGLDHPGQDLPTPPPPGSDPDYDADPESLMGRGMNLRPQNFNTAFCNHISTNKPGCSSWQAQGSP